MAKKPLISIIIFPGSNCDRDLKVAIEKNFEIKVNLIWHKTAHLENSKINGLKLRMRE